MPDEMNFNHNKAYESDGPMGSKIDELMELAEKNGCPIMIISAVSVDDENANIMVLQNSRNGMMPDAMVVAREVLSLESEHFHVIDHIISCMRSSDINIDHVRSDLLHAAQRIVTDSVEANPEMPINITTTRQSTDAVKMLVFGESGMGKTTLCSTAPKPVIISAEKGLLSLAEFDLPAIEVQGWSELEEAYEWCMSNKDKYETICLDSITELAEIRLSELQAQFADGRKVYGELQSDVPLWIRKFRDIPDKHVFFIAQIDRIEDAYSGISTYRPTMPGKYLIKKLPFFFDEVLCLRIGEMRKEDGSTEEYRYLQTQPDISYHAKDRSGKLAKVERPNLKMIINKVMGKVTPKKVAKTEEESK